MAQLARDSEWKITSDTPLGWRWVMFKVTQNNRALHNDNEATTEARRLADGHVRPALPLMARIACKNKRMKHGDELANENKCRWRRWRVKLIPQKSRSRVTRLRAELAGDSNSIRINWVRSWSSSYDRNPSKSRFSCGTTSVTSESSSSSFARPTSDSNSIEFAAIGTRTPAFDRLEFFVNRSLVTLLRPPIRA